MVAGKESIRLALRQAQRKLCEARFEQSAFTGWLYTSVIDREFLDAQLPDGCRPSRDPATTVNCQFSSGSQTSRDGLAPRELYEHLQAMIHDERLAQDSYGPLDQVFSEETLNILVIGGGCTGLAAANSLKRAFGDHVRILVVENRIVESHRKRPYARDWMTFIRLDVLHNLIDERVYELLARVGDQGFMGVPLNVFETLLLESCQQLGVRFLFDKITDYSPLIAAGADLIIDASGGRLIAEDAPATEPGPTFTERDLQDYGAGYRRFGITRTLTARKAEVETIRRGNTLYPAVAGQRMKVASFKLTNVPIRLYQYLLDTVRGKNGSSRFYIWPGMLQPEINKLLLIINLRRAEFEALHEQLDAPTPLAEFLAANPMLSQLDGDVWELLRAVHSRVQPKERVRIEPPFVYAPYLKPYRCQEDLLGVPLIRIGDSVFNGNPKTGNGLSRHLAHLRVVRECLRQAAGC